MCHINSTFNLCHVNRGTQCGPCKAKDSPSSGQSPVYVAKRKIRTNIERSTRMSLVPPAENIYAFRDRLQNATRPSTHQNLTQSWLKVQASISTALHAYQLALLSRTPNNYSGATNRSRTRRAPYARSSPRRSPDVQQSTTVDSHCRELAPLRSRWVPGVSRVCRKALACYRCRQSEALVRTSRR